MPATPPKKKRSGCLTAIVVAVVALVGLGVVLAVAGGGDEPSTSESVGVDTGDGPVAEEPSGDAATEELPGSEGDGDEVDDVASCNLIDAETLELDITNNSSKQSSYVIDVNFLDAAGARVGDEPFFVNHVRSGERVVEQSYVFDSKGGTQCEVAEVDRFESESPDPVDEVTCEVTGVDALDDVATALTATNGSSETSDYFIDAALMRDGVRFGTVSASIENVRAGESAPGDGFSVADGPADGVTCEVVYVERMTSE